MQAVYLAYVLPVKAEIQSLDVFIYYTRLLYCSSPSCYTIVGYICGWSLCLGSVHESRVHVFSPEFYPVPQLFVFQPLLCPRSLHHSAQNK